MFTHLASNCPQNCGFDISGLSQPCIYCRSLELVSSVLLTIRFDTCVFNYVHDHLCMLSGKCKSLFACDVNHRAVAIRSTHIINVFSC